MRRWFGLILIAGSAWAQSNTLDILAGLRDQPLNPVLLRDLKGRVPLEPEPATKVRLGVLYALGSFASGNREEGLAARAALRKNFPGHDLLQDLADDRISDPCGECRQGALLDPCPSCGGTGKCPPCKGAGQQTLPGLGEQTRKVKCMYCVDAPGKCRKCGGAKGFSKPCPACSGTGLIVSAEKAGTLYLRMLKALAPPREDKEPAMLVVTAAPPGKVEADPAALQREWVERAVSNARAQVESTPLLRKHGITAEEIRQLGDPGVPGPRREALVKALRERGLPHARGHYFFLPFPKGLRYGVADMKKNAYGGYFLKLTSTPPARNPPAVPPTPREVLGEAARILCEPLGDFLSDPTVCVPDSDVKSSALRKGEAVESGAWIVPVQLTQWGGIQKEGACYRTPDEALAQLGISR